MALERGSGFQKIFLRGPLIGRRVAVPPKYIASWWDYDFERQTIELLHSDDEMATSWRIRSRNSHHEFRWTAPAPDALRKIRSVESEAKKIAASCKTSPAHGRQGVRL